MSAKKAKKIRKEIKYTPSNDDRSYVKVARSSTLELNPIGRRALYQEMKKERQ